MTSAVGPWVAAGGLAALVLVRPGATPAHWRDPAAAWFAAVAAAALLWLSPGLPPAWGGALADTGMALFPGTILLFGAALFPDAVPRRAGPVILALGTVLAGWTATAPPGYVAWEAVGALGLLAIALLFLLAGGLRALRDRRPGAVSLVAGALVLAAALARDALAVERVTAFHPYALLVFAVIAASLLERRDRRTLAAAQEAAADAAEAARVAEADADERAGAADAAESRAADAETRHAHLRATVRHHLRTPLAGLAALVGDPASGTGADTAVARAAAALRRSAAAAAGSDDRLAVLVVEDVAVSRRLAHDLLRAEGHDVATVADGESAVAAAETGRYDLVLMDIRLPDVDGLEATRRIRALPDPQAARVPVIALTADVAPADVAAYQGAGMDGATAKPLDAGRLYAVLAAATPAATADEAVADGPPIVDARWTALAGTFGPDELAGFLDTLEESVNDGLATVRHQRAAGDAHAAARSAHRIAGAAANFGFAALEAAAARLERALDTPDRGDADPATLAEALESEAASALATVHRLRGSLRGGPEGDQGRL